MARTQQVAPANERPPSTAGSTRARLDALLNGAWDRRVTVVIAGGGFGKTTALGRLGRRGTVSWLTMRAADREIEPLARRLADALGIGAPVGLAAPTAAIGAEDRQRLAEGQAAILCESVAESDEQRLLVLDDVDQLSDPDASVHLLRALCLGAPPQLHLVLAGRRLPALGLGAVGGPGALLEITAPDLAFTAAETGALLADRLGAVPDGLAENCQSLTGGWPAALQLIVDRLERVPTDRRVATLDRLPVHGSRMWREFVADILTRESGEAHLILSAAALAPRVDPGLLASLGVTDAEAELASLQDRGLLVSAGGGSDPGPAMSPVLADTIAEQLPPARAEDLRQRISTWLESADRLEEALECRAAGSPAELAAFLGRQGHELVGRGLGSRVIEILTPLEPGVPAEREAILGAALQSTGDWDGAMEMFRQVHRQAVPALPAPIAWRFGALLYLRGDSELALEVLSAAHDPAGQGADEALVSAWLSSTLWSRGSTEGAAATAEIALLQADASGASGARAAAHVAVALAAASAGQRERNERHYRMALIAAVDAGDSIQLARIRANLSSRALEEGDYAGAIAEADRALNAGSGHKFFAALAMCNQAEALLHLGEHDAARATLLEVLETYSALGSLVECAPRTLLGVLYRERGDLARARVSFEHARRLAEQGEDVHTLVFALCGLAKTLAEDDPRAARAHVTEAIARATSLERAHALCSAAWVALYGADGEAATALAQDAEREARGTGDRPSLAEALLLQGLASRPTNEEQLEHAAELWGEVGDPVAEQRARLALAICRRDDASADALRRTLSERGANPELGPAPLEGPVEPPSADLVIVTLGRFAVLHAGERVAPGAWQSRKARDLLKVLVARRGRVITRDAAAEALWPGEPAGPLSNRLSVALSTLRKVLDPERSHPPDHFIVADGQSLALRLENVSLDVVGFLCAAAAGVALAADGEHGAAELRLQEAERLYTGDFLEDDVYEDWAVECRETARSAALEVSRLLARAASEEGDDETASRHLHRLLERDAYDEEAWLALVAAQARLRRYGEARRQHGIYARRMAELAVAPVPLAEAVAARNR